MTKAIPKAFIQRRRKSGGWPMLTAVITAVLTNFCEVWDNLSPREQSRLVSLLIERVEYDGREGNVSIAFHPTGIRALRDEMATPEQVA